MTAIFDAVVIVIILIAVIVGLSKGFMKSVWGLVTIAVIGASLYFVAPPLTKIVVEKTTLDASIAKPVEKLFAKIKGMDTVLQKDDSATFAVLKQKGVPAVIVNYMEKSLNKDIPSGGITAKGLLANKTAELAILIIVGIVLTIAAGIVLILLKKLLVGMVKIKVVKPVDKIFGVFYCTAITALVLMTIGGIAFTLSEQTFMKTVNTGAENSKVFKYIYSENPLQSVFDKYANVGNLIKKV